MNTGKLNKYVIGKMKNELSGNLTYHGLQHTVHVLAVCNLYIRRMKLKSEDAYLLRTTAIMHDTGYLWNIDNHEDSSIKYVRELLANWNYTAIQIERIIGMIEATKIPQKTTTHLEQIIGDADLDYLGTEAFYRVGNKLYKELLSLHEISNEKEWNQLQKGNFK